MLKKKIQCNFDNLSWEISKDKKKYGQNFCFLDNSMAKNELKWKPVMDMKQL